MAGRRSGACAVAQIQHLVPQVARLARTEFDPFLPFKIGAVNGREGRGSGLRLSARIVPVAIFVLAYTRLLEVFTCKVVEEI